MNNTKYFSNHFKPYQEGLPIVKRGQKTFVFIHINKTGGTSIAKTIGLRQKLHYTARDLERLIGKSKWKKAFKFSFVRNPWDKVVSHYKYRVKTNQTRMGEQPICFNHWVTITYGPNKDPFYYDKPKMFLPQVDWLKNLNNEICVDMIGRFESIASDFEKIAIQIGIDPSLPHLNQTPKTNYRDCYNQKTRNIIAECFKEDLAYFNYDF